MFSGEVNNFIEDICDNTLVIIDTKNDNTGIKKNLDGEIEITMIGRDKLELEDIFS